MKKFATLFALLAAAFSLSAQTTFERGVFGSVPLRINANSNYVVNSPWVELRASGGVGIVPVIAATNASGSNVVFTFQFSADKVNAITVRSPTYTLALNGTNGVVGYTNFATLDLAGHASNLIATDSAGLQWMRLQSITNGHSSSLWVTNVSWIKVR